MSTRDNTPSIREIADLTARLRDLSTAGRNADPAEREAFLADKDALLARIQARESSADDVLARAVGGGYAMVGPSARIWSVDPTTGVPVGPVSEVEHRQVQDLIAQERLDGAEPQWLRCDDGTDEIVALVIPALAEFDEDIDDEDIDDDGWFTDGYDDAHTAHLDALDHVDAEPLTDDSSQAAAAVEETHQAVTPLTASCQRASDRVDSAEAMDRERGDQRTADDDIDVDGDGWAR